MSDRTKEVLATIFVVVVGGLATVAVGSGFIAATLSAWRYILR